jgi:hypothetical protein
LAIELDEEALADQLGDETRARVSYAADGSAIVA